MIFYYKIDFVSVADIASKFKSSGELWCRYRSDIRTLPLVARVDTRTADATLVLAHAPSGRTGS